MNEKIAYIKAVAHADADYWDAVYEEYPQLAKAKEITGNLERVYLKD